MPVGAGGAELIGAEAPPTSDFGDPVVPSWSSAGATGGGPERCKFLRTISSDGKLSDPGREAVPTHRCAAFGDPLPLSLRQQELVCLQRVHVSCPRYMRGTLLAEESAAAAQSAPAKGGLPYLMITGLFMVAAAGVILVAAMMGVIPGMGVGNGSSPTSSASLIAANDTPSASPTDEVTPTPLITATPSPSATASASPSVKPSPTVSPSPTVKPSITPTPRPTPTPTPSWPPGATASRMNLLVPCTGQANCYVYTVRSAAQNGSPVNDTIDGIARFFGVKKADIYALSPWARNGIKPGDKLKIPPPTR